MERRTARRIKARTGVAFHAQGSEHQALTFDISRDGCKLQISAGFLEAGSEIELAFGKDVNVIGRVVWVDGRNAGIRFANALDAEAIGAILYNAVGKGLRQSSAHVLRPLLSLLPFAVAQSKMQCILENRVGLHIDSTGAVRYSRSLELAGLLGLSILILAAWAELFSTLLI